MTTYTPDRENGHDGTDTELDDRDVRALTECMVVIPEGGDIYTVVGENQNGEYRVDTREGRCTCADFKHNLPTSDGRETCKHRARVAFATGEREVPAWVDTSAVDELLGEHTDATPRVAATDGGSPADEVLPDSWLSFDDTDDGRPDECSCIDWNTDGIDTPCWPCYREGFRSPAAGE